MKTLVSRSLRVYRSTTASIRFLNGGSIATKTPYENDLEQLAVVYSDKQELHARVNDRRNNPLSNFEIVGSIELLESLHVNCNIGQDDLMCQVLFEKFLKVPLDYINTKRTSKAFFCFTRAKFKIPQTFPVHLERDFGNKIVYCLPRSNSHLFRNLLKLLRHLDWRRLTPEVKTAIGKTLCGLVPLPAGESSELLLLLNMVKFTTINTPPEVNQVLFHILRRALAVDEVRPRLLRDAYDVTLSQLKDMPVECQAAVFSYVNRVMLTTSEPLEQLDLIYLLGQMGCSLSAVSSDVHRVVLDLVSRRHSSLQEHFTALLLGVNRMGLSYDHLSIPDKVAYDHKLLVALRTAQSRYKPLHVAYLIESLPLTGLCWSTASEELRENISRAIVDTPMESKEVVAVLAGLKEMRTDFNSLSQELQTFIASRLDDPSLHSHHTSCVKVLELLAFLQVPLTVIPLTAFEKTIRNFRDRLKCPQMVRVLASLARLNVSWDSLHLNTRQVIADHCVDNIKNMNKELLKSTMYGLCLTSFDSDEHSTPSSPLFELHSALCNTLQSTHFHVDQVFNASVVGSYVTMLRMYETWHDKADRIAARLLIYPLVSNKPHPSALPLRQGYVVWPKPVLFSVPTFSHAAMAVCEVTGGAPQEEQDVKPVCFITMTDLDPSARIHQFKVALLKSHYPQVDIVHCKRGDDVIQAVIDHRRNVNVKL